MGTNLFNPADHRNYPSRWPAYRGKRLFHEIDDRSQYGTEELLSVSHITGVTPRSQKNVTMFKSESLVGYKRCLVGDIAANTMWMWQGAIGVSRFEGVVSPSYNVYRQNADYYNPRFLDLLLREHKLIDVYHSLSTGIRPSRLRLYPEEFLTIDFPVPPRAEQDQIVRYLDWKASEVNQLILMLQKEITLLQEAKDIVLNETITKGLYEEDYKDSGEPIIGEIPSTWDVCELKYVSKIYNGNSISDSEKDNYTVKTALPYIATKDVDLTSHTADYENGLYVQPDSNFKIAPAGCTLVCIEGGSAGIKKAFISRDVAFVNKLCAFAPINMNDRFLFHFLCSPAFTNQFMRSVTGVIGGVSINEVKRILVPVPSREEQDIIAKKLDEKCEKFDNKILKLNAEIKLLKEYRERLISDVVTGQIDVRDIEIPEYEYVEETADINSEEMTELEESEDEEV